MFNMPGLGGMGGHGRGQNANSEATNKADTS